MGTALRRLIANDAEVVADRHAEDCCCVPCVWARALDACGARCASDLEDLGRNFGAGVEGNAKAIAVVEAARTRWHRGYVESERGWRLRFAEIEDELATVRAGREWGPWRARSIEEQDRLEAAVG